MKKINRWFLRGLFGIGLFILCCLCFIWAFSPDIVRHVARDYLKPHDLVMTDESVIRINPFTASLSIRNLKLMAAEKPSIHINELIFDVNIGQLFQRTVLVESASINGLSLDVVSESDNIIVAGFELPLAAAPDSPSAHEANGTSSDLGTNTQAPHVSSVQTTHPWLINLPLLSINNVVFTIDDHKTTHTFSINKLTLHNNRILKDNIDITFAAQLAINNAPITLSGHFQKEKTTALELDLAADELLLHAFNRYFPPIENAVLSMDLKTQITMMDNVLHIQNDNFKFNIEQFIAKQNQQTLRFKSLDINGDGLTIKQDSKAANTLHIHSEPLRVGMNGLTAKETGHTLRFDELNLDSNKLSIKHDKEGLHVTALANVSSTNLSLRNHHLDSLLAQWENLTIDTIRFGFEKRGSHQDIKLGVHKVDFQRLLASKNSQHNALLEIDTGTLDKIELANNQLNIQTIGFTQLKNHVVIDKNKAIATLVKPEQEQKVNPANDDAQPSPESNDTSTPATAQTASKLKKPFGFLVKQFLIGTDSQLHFVDQSVSPNYKQTINFERIEVTNISSDPDTVTEFVVDGRSGKYASIKLKGNIQPFTDTVNLKLDGDIKEVDLPAISSYIKDALGFALQSGQLDTKIQVKVKKSEITGDVHLNMRGVDMTAANDEQANSLKDKTAIPLNTALGMLMDSKGNIELEIPLSGSVDDPEFGISSFIGLVTKKALMSATRSYLMNTFVPYANVVSVALAASEFVLNVRFENLTYEPGIVVINESQQTYLDQFVALMKSNEQLQVKVCPVTTLQELPAEQQSANAEQQTQWLIELAKQRGDQFKQYVTETGKLDSSRILLCSPQLDRDKDALPRIEISS